MAKKRKSIFKFNFFLLLFLGFLIFTAATFLIVTINENKNKNETPRTISCRDLNLIEEEIIKLFPNDIFITKDLSDMSSVQSSKIIILEDQSKELILEKFKSNLDISLLGYGIYEEDTKMRGRDFNFKKGDYNFSISFGNSYDFIQNEKVFKLPKNPVTLVLKCLKDKQNE